MSCRIAIIADSLFRSNASLRSYFETLDVNERARADGLADERLRCHFIAGRGLLRAILARHLKCAPELVKLETGALGKPRLAGDHPLKFNLSHSGGRIAVALSWECEVGIDIERARPEMSRDIESMAAHAFHPEIGRRIAALPPPRRRAAFYRQWTKQEAILKARGTGFSPVALSSAPSVVTVRELALGRGLFGAIAAEADDFEFSVRHGFGTMDFRKPGRYSPASLAARRAPEIHR